MHTQTTEKTVYQFGEMPDLAKEKAMDTMRGWAFTDSSDWEHVFDYAKEVGAVLGFTDMTIFFSGFWSQGDGACFESSYRYVKDFKKNIEAYRSGTLTDIAGRLTALQKKHFYKLQGTTKHRGRYYHEHCMDIHLDCDIVPIGAESEEEFKEICADFARWIYKTLESEYEYQTSEEYIKDLIDANGYEFDEDGQIVRG